MGTIASLVVKLEGNIEGFKASLEQAEKTTKMFENGTMGSLAKIGKGIVIGGIAAATSGVVAMAEELTKDVEAAEKMQNTQANLAQTLANTGKVSGVTVGQVNALAESLSSITTFSDDDITSASALMATYKEINASTFPVAIQRAMDLSTKLGIDLPSATKLLGKALETPGEGLARLKVAGVAFTTVQDKMIQQMAAAGHTAKAQQLILDALAGSVGGAAEAAGSTASGQWAIFHNKLEETREMVGSKMLPSITMLGNMLTTALNRPEVQAFITNLATNIGNFASRVVANLPAVFAWFQKAFGWLSQHKGVVVAALAGMAAAVLAFGIQVAAAAIMAEGPLLPAIAVMVAVAAVAYGIYEAVMHWGAIKDFLEKLWSSVVAGLTTAWNAILNALKAVGDYISNVFMTVWNDEMNGLKIIGDWLSGTFTKIWTGISNAIKSVIDWVDKFINILKNIKLPSWLTPGSPTPFEYGLIGIHDMLQKLAGSSLPDFTARLNLLPPDLVPVTASMAGIGGGRNNYSGETNFNFYGYDTDQICNAIRDKLNLQGAKTHH